MPAELRSFLLTLDGRERCVEAAWEGSEAEALKLPHPETQRRSGAGAEVG